MPVVDNVCYRFIQTGKLVELSEQQMVDCTWKVKGVWNGQGNRGCHGGTAWKVLYWAKTNIIATNKSYGPYRGQVRYFVLIFTDGLT